MFAVREELGSPPNTSKSATETTGSVTSFWLRKVATSLSQRSGESGNLVCDVSTRFLRSSTLTLSFRNIILIIIIVIIFIITLTAWLRVAGSLGLGSAFFSVDFFTSGLAAPLKII